MDKSARNLATERIVRRAGLPYLRFRYEDLVADPARTLSAITELGGVPAAALPLGSCIGRGRRWDGGSRAGRSSAP